MSTHLSISLHPQTCELHFVDPDLYRDKLERKVRSLYHPMGVRVSVGVLQADVLPDEDYSHDWAVAHIGLPGMQDAEARTILNMAGRVFAELMKSVSPVTH